MKKLATFAVLAALAMSAQAASILWGFGGKVYLNKGEDTVLATDGSAPEVAAGSYLALVYLGQNISSYPLDDITTDMAVDTLSYSVTTSGKAAAIGKWNPNTSTYDDTTMESGASFTVLFFNGKTSSFDYIYALSGTDKGSAYDSNIVTVTSDNMEIANSSIYATGGTGSNNGVVAVPEPSTAALALAGLALLLKRRKA